MARPRATLSGTPDELDELDEPDPDPDEDASAAFEVEANPGSVALGISAMKPLGVGPSPMGFASGGSTTANDSGENAPWMGATRARRKNPVAGAAPSPS